MSGDLGDLADATLGGAGDVVTSAGETAGAVLDGVAGVVNPVAGTVEAVAGMVTAIAEAADVPDEVKISREGRKRAREIAQGSRKLAADLLAMHRHLARIDGEVDTVAERHAKVKADKALAKAHGWYAELVAAGVPKKNLPKLPPIGG